MSLLRLLTECFILVGSDMFGATFNLVTRAGLQKIFVKFEQNRIIRNIQNFKLFSRNGKPFWRKC